MNYRMALLVVASAVLLASAAAALPHMHAAAQSHTGTTGEGTGGAPAPWGIVPTDGSVGPVGTVDELYEAHGTITDIMIDHSDMDYSLADELVFTMTYVDEPGRELVVMLDPVLLSLGLIYDHGDIEDLLGTEDIKITVQYGVFSPYGHIHPSSQSSIDRWISLYDSRCSSASASSLCRALAFNLGTQNHYTLGSNNRWNPPGAGTPEPTAPKTPDAPPGSTNTLFSDDFEDGTLGKWTESGEPDWRADAFDERRQPPGHSRTNTVAEADDCDSACTITTTAPIDITGVRNPVLEFWRYVDRSLDEYDGGAGEYLKAEVTTNGRTWTQLDLWTEEDGDDDDKWHKERYDLAPYISAAFQVRFVASMSTSGEDVGIDDVRVHTTSAVPSQPQPADTVPPVITTPGNITRALTGSALGAHVNFTVTATDNVDGPVNVTCNRGPGWYAAGTYAVSCAAADGAGNNSTAAFTITVTDPPPTNPLPKVPTAVAQNELRGGMPIRSFGVPPIDAIRAYASGSLGVVVENSTGFKLAITASHVVSYWTSFSHIHLDTGDLLSSPTIGNTIAADPNVGKKGTVASSDAASVIVTGDGVAPALNQIQAGTSVLNVTKFGGLADLTYPAVQKSARLGISNGTASYQNVTVSFTKSPFSYTLTGQAAVTSMVSGGGDSGGPIYINHGNGTAQLLGILAGGTCKITTGSGGTITLSGTDAYDNPLCRNGTPNEFVIFSPWENVSADLGIRQIQ